MSTPPSLLWCAVAALAGVLQVDAGPGHIVMVDGRLATYDQSGMVQVELAEGAHRVEVRPLLGRRMETVVQVPAEGAVRLVRDGGGLVLAPPIDGTEVAATPAPTVFEIPERAIPVPHGSRGFLVPIRLEDGTEVEALFDTGATRLGLCPELARAGGFVETGSGQSITPHGLVTVKHGMLPSIELLGHRLSRVSVTVYPDSPCTVTMLGMEQLAHLEAVLRDDTLWVWIGAPSATAGSPTFRLDVDGALSARVQVGERLAEFTVDTGASHVFLSTKLADAVDAQPTGETVTVEGPLGLLEVPLVKIPVLTIDGFEAHDVAAARLEGWPEGGLLGRSALMAFEGEWRFSRGRASLHP